MNLDLIQALNQLEKEKNIPKDMLFEAVEAALLSAYRKNYKTTQNVSIYLNRETGEVKVFAKKRIMNKVKNPNTEISIEDAKNYIENPKIGDIIEIEITPAEFGRIAAQTAKQVVIQRICEAERKVIYREYSEKEKEILTGTIQRFEGENIVINLGKTEGILPPQEQIKEEHYYPGKKLKVYLVEVRRTSKGPKIIVSRTHPGLIKGLFELEVPEVYEGLVEIKAIAREPGKRTKIAVFSRDKNIDPVGTCIGNKGVRIRNILSELGEEKIDIVKWEKEPSIFIKNALSPAKIISINISKEDRIANVLVPQDQLSLAIGREGQNVRLAVKLTGWRIDIKSEGGSEGKGEE